MENIDTEKTLLIAGKEIPDGEDLAAGAMTHSRKVFVTTAATSFANTDTGAVIVPWNRGSALSARSLVLSCMNRSNSLDEAVLVFDEGVFVQKYSEYDVAEITRILEELIAGYQYLTAEILAKYKHNNIGAENIKTGKIAFVWISAQSRAAVNVSINPLIASASAAFKAFAEETSRSLVEIEEALPVMVKVETSTDISRRDSSLMGWLCEYMDGVDAMTKRPGEKFFENWVKPGSKPSSGRGLFG